MPNPGDFTPTNLAYLIGEDSDNTAIAPGGRVERFIADSQALNVGDVVYVSSTGAKVDKAAVAANYQTYVGVVVGGRQTGDRAMSMSSMVGVKAANAGELVLVQTTGKAWVTSDAAIAAVGKVAAGAVTAGRVSTTGVLAGQTIGLALQTAGAAAVVILMHILHM